MCCCFEDSFTERELREAFDGDDEQWASIMDGTHPTIGEFLGNNKTTTGGGGGRGGRRNDKERAPAKPTGQKSAAAQASKKTKKGADDHVSDAEKDVKLAARSLTKSAKSLG